MACAGLEVLGILLVIDDVLVSVGVGGDIVDGFDETIDGDGAASLSSVVEFSNLIDFLVSEGIIVLPQESLELVGVDPLHIGNTQSVTYSCRERSSVLGVGSLRTCHPSWHLHSSARL